MRKREESNREEQTLTKRTKKMIINAYTEKYLCSDLGDS